MYENMDLKVMYEEKQNLMYHVDNILSKYDPQQNSENTFIKLLKVIKDPEIYIPKNDDYSLVGFEGDHGIIHKIPNKGREWESLVYLEHIIILFLYINNDYELIYKSEIKSDEDIEDIIRSLSDKQYMKGLATTLRKSNNKLTSKRLLNKLIHCDDKQQDIPKIFKGGNIFSGEWTREKIINAQDILIDIFIENKHLVPILTNGIVRSAYENQLKELYFSVLSKLLRIQTIEIGNIKTLINMNSGWKNAMILLEKIKSLDPVNFNLYDIITKSESYDFIVNCINKRWEFKNSRKVQSDVKQIEKERKQRKNTYSGAINGVRTFSSRELTARRLNPL